MIETVRRSRIASVMMVFMLLASMSGAFTMDSLAQTVALKDYQAMQVAATPDQADVPADDADVPAEGDGIVPGAGEGDVPAEEDPENNEGPVELAPASREGDFSIAAESGAGDPAFYCDFRNQPGQGDIATWWANNNVAPDCINLSITNSPETCSLTANFASYVYALGRYGDTLYWFETDANGTVLRNPNNTPTNWGNSGQTGPSGSSFTLNFAEDYKGGTAYVLINFASPENQIRPGLEKIDTDHWRTTSKGIVYEINTDCVSNVTNYCDFAQIDTAQSVSYWLTNAKEGFNTDCIDLETPVEVCGSVTIPLTEEVEPFNYWIEYVEGTDLNATATVAPGGVIAFPEDYNNGEVTVTVYIGGPEQDFVEFANEGDYAYAEGGVTFIIDTDCKPPVNYCDYAQLVGAGDVYNWLANAPEGALTDCFTVGTAVEACGSLNIPFSETVEPYTYQLLWAEGTSIPADDSLWNTTWPITFPEDYSDGSVDVIVFVGGPEDDYYHFGGEDLGKYPYPYPNIDRGDIPARSLGGGVQYTIDTNCQIPATPTPTETETPVVTPTETPVTPVVTPTEAPVTPAPTAPVVTTLPSTGTGDDAGNSTMIWLTLAGISMLVVAGLGIRRNQVR